MAGDKNDLFILLFNVVHREGVDRRRDGQEALAWGLGAPAQAWLLGLAPPDPKLEPPFAV